MLLVFLGLGIIKGNIIIVEGSNNVEISLKYKLKDSYYNMFDYRYFSVPFSRYAVVFPKYVDDKEIEIPSLDGNKEEILQKAVDYMKQYSYTKYNSDVSLLNFTGEGNCQSLSLMFKVILDKYGIDNRVIGDDSHVFNEVTVDNKTYIIDFSKSSIELVE